MTGPNPFTSRRVLPHFRGTWRETEENCLKHIANTENRIANTLCECHVLPEGVVCDKRKETNGLYFCPQGKEGCPLRG